MAMSFSRTRAKYFSKSSTWWMFCAVIILCYVVPGQSDQRQLLNLRGVSLTEDIGASNLTNGPLPVANLTVPLHAHSGTHHVHVYIGSPPQRQTLIVDTGSRVMAFPCKACRNCGNHASPYFDVSRSTTNKESQCGQCLLGGISSCSLFGNHCEINQKYTEGSSWTAKEVEDIVWLGTSNVVESIEDHMQLAIPYAFGCQTDIHGLFQKQYADGILGMALHETSIVAAYYEAQAISTNAFSLCLSPDAGHLSLGGSMPTEHHLEPMKATPIVRSHGWYSVGIEKLYVGDIEVVSSDKTPSLLKKLNGRKGCILDSGTTDTYLPADLSKPLGEAAMAWTNGLTDFSETLRYKSYTFLEYNRLPTITLTFVNDVNLTISPKDYMEGVPSVDSNDNQEWKGSKPLVNRIYLDEPEGTVLGANAMLGYDILFDSTSRKVGLARADCSAEVQTAIS